ncbi:Coiled-coil domain-containing protein 63 [Clonorchis sinensis]|uniref:Coiled-coil domain-containing protein 63 n=1 Tax=Clonorchis sinensis TaxID=79923 RepID=A0A3R7CXN7_CLOSI|nr:Coiled-coil domain-containing protein 63 [Clonorchis sinensis]
MTRYLDCFTSPYMAPSRAASSINMKWVKTDSLDEEFATNQEITDPVQQIFTKRVVVAPEQAVPPVPLTISHWQQHWKCRTFPLGTTVSRRKLKHREGRVTSKRSLFYQHTNPINDQGTSEFKSPGRGWFLQVPKKKFRVSLGRGSIILAAEILFENQVLLKNSRFRRLSVTNKYLSVGPFPAFWAHVGLPTSLYPKSTFFLSCTYFGLDELDGMQPLNSHVLQLVISTVSHRWRSIFLGRFGVHRLIQITFSFLLIFHGELQEGTRNFNIRELSNLRSFGSMSRSTKTYFDLRLLLEQRYTYNRPTTKVSFKLTDSFNCDFYFFLTKSSCPQGSRRFITFYVSIKLVGWPSALEFEEDKDDYIGDVSDEYDDSGSCYDEDDNTVNLHDLPVKFTQMQRPASAYSEGDDGADSALQEEYDRLQNQLRNVQNERQRQTNEANVKLGRYNNEIELLEAENRELNMLLSLNNSSQNKKKDMKALEDLKQLLEQQEALHEKIDQTKAHHKQLDSEIRSLEKKICQKQQERAVQVKNEKEAGEEINQLEKRTLNMEANLHTKTSKFCETLANNDRTRGDIEKLLNERRMYVALHKRLTEKLNDINKMKAKLTQHASAAFDQREEANTRIQTLKEKNEKDRLAYEAEVRELQRIIDYNAQLQHFMLVKSNERLEWKQEAEERKRKHGATGEIAQRQQRQKLEEYEVSMSRIMTCTGKEDVSEMVKVYLVNEDQNFTTFNYVTEVNNQIEDLKAELERIRRDTDECQSNREEQQRQKHQIMHKYEVQMNADKEASDAAELRTAQIRKILDQVKSQVKHLAQKLGCDTSKIVEMMGGDGAEVTERNLMLYISVLEQRVDELLSVKCYNSSKSDERQGKPTHEGSLTLLEVPHVEKEITASLPSLSDEDDENGESVHSSIRPFTQAEILHRVTRDLQRYAASTGADQHKQHASSRHTGNGHKGKNNQHSKMAIIAE